MKLPHCICTSTNQHPAPPYAEGGNRVVRLARLPTRVFADGSFARGVAVEGLYGLARLTVHEAELSLDSGRDPNAGGRVVAEYMLPCRPARVAIRSVFVWYQRARQPWFVYQRVGHAPASACSSAACCCR